MSDATGEILTTTPKEPEGEQTVGRPADSTPFYLACMGTSACSRVCKYLNPKNQTGPSTDGLPDEQNCKILENLDPATIPPEAARELLKYTMLPDIDSMSSVSAKKVASNTTEYLRYQQRTFDEYLRQILANAPRFVLAGSQQIFATSLEQDLRQPATEEERVCQDLIRVQARGFYDNNTLKEHGLLFDSGLREYMEAIAMELSLGHHVALSGEPGIAKTKLAKYMARLNSAAHQGESATEQSTEPVVLSFSSTSEAESHLSKQTFSDGTLGSELGLIAEAMLQGRGVVLDEYNGMSADQSIFLNDILLKQPGDTVRIAGRDIKIAKGFCVIATLNPMTDTQGQRRHGRQQQDSAGAARFTRIDLHYPGADLYRGNSKETLHRLFMAAWADSYGWQLPSKDNLVLATEISDYVAELAKLATSPQRDGTSLIGQGNSVPLLAECITPRDLDRLLRTCFVHVNTGEADRAVRKAIYEKTRQILSSNNGHSPPIGARPIVDEVIRRHNIYTDQPHA